MSLSDYLPSVRQVQRALYAPAVLIVSYGVVDAMGTLMSPEEAAKWSEECKEAVTELGFCLLQGMVSKVRSGAALDPRGANYNCETQTDEERMARHNVPLAERGACGGLFDSTREHQGGAYVQGCLDRDCERPVFKSPLRP
jgi:hypothetical protein